MLCSEILFFYNSKCNILNLAFRVSCSTRSQSQMKMLRRTPDDPNASDWSNQRTFRTTYNASKIKNLKRFNFG